MKYVTMMTMTARACVVLMSLGAALSDAVNISQNVSKNTTVVVLSNGNIMLDGILYYRPVTWHSDLCWRSDSFGLAVIRTWR